MPANSELVDVSIPFVLLCAAPLTLVAFCSYSMGLQLESPLLVGCLRTFLQLSLLALILKPIFAWGQDYPIIVVCYGFLMVVITSYEATQRSPYYFANMYLYVLGSFVVATSLVSLWTFGVIVRPNPIWDPQYVIPLLGMLLGNSVNGSSLSLKTMLRALVEESAELELCLSFGASCGEASRRLLSDAVRTGALPMLNSMAVIGLIYIPGMMTGQILGGSNVMEASRYQMLIMYLVAQATFGVILMEVFWALRVGFDVETSMLRTDRLQKREPRRSFLETIAAVFASGGNRNNSNSKDPRYSSGEVEALYGTAENDTNDGLVSTSLSSYADAQPKGELDVSTLWTASPSSSLSSSYQSSSSGVTSTEILFEVSNLQCSFAEANTTANNHNHNSRRNRHQPHRKVIFRNLSFSVRHGEICLVTGPSGSGKSSLLRVLAGLTPMDETGQYGDIRLQSKSWKEFGDLTAWRRRIRYVTQYKISIPGSPMDFLRQFTSFQSWKEQHTGGNTSSSLPSVPSKKEVLTTCKDLIQQWGLEVSDLDKEWSQLSGGEAQRVLVAMALASKPTILLCDEITSALDLERKLKVEGSVQEFARNHGMAVLWITHDVEQIERLRMNRN